MEVSAPTSPNHSVTHDYYPLGVQLPGYAPNESPVPELLAPFALQWIAVTAGAFLLIGRLRPTASLSDRLAFTWMSLSISSQPPASHPLHPL